MFEIVRLTVIVLVCSGLATRAALYLAQIPDIFGARLKIGVDANEYQWVGGEGNRGDGVRRSS